jgi:hypothetical protein
MKPLKMLAAALITLSCMQVGSLVGPTAAVAQEDTEAKKQEDDTGTNPINFTYDARFYSETSWLPVDNSSLITNTFEFRAPLGRDLANLTNQKAGIFNDLGSRHALRLKVRTKSLNVDTGEGQNTNISGIGDLDLRWLYIPYVTNKFGIAGGLEAFFPTATNDALYLFDVAGDDDRARVNQHQVDIYFVWLLAQMRHWLIINPQLIFDVENSKEFMIVDVEFGYMIPPLPGASIYLRPGAGVGADRPLDWTFEFGFKFIWR